MGSRGGRGRKSSLATTVTSSSQLPVELEPEETFEESGDYYTTEGMYDIEDYAEERGYDSAESMISDNLSELPFFTVKQEMYDAIEDLDYVVVGDNGEYLTIIDDRDESDSEFAVYYNVSGRTHVIREVRKLT